MVSEYHRKYNSELKRETVTGNLERKLKEFLKGAKSLTNRQLTWFHWMVEYLLIPKDVRKNYIEDIIEPELLPTEESIRNRMKLIV